MESSALLSPSRIATSDHSQSALVASPPGCCLFLLVFAGFCRFLPVFALFFALKSFARNSEIFKYSIGCALDNRMFDREGKFDSVGALMGSHYQ